MSLVLRYSTHTTGGAVSCGGGPKEGPEGIFPINTPINAVFDQVTKQQNITGSTEYRLLYLYNDGKTRIYNPTVALTSVPESEIAIGGLAKNAVGDRIQSESSAPSSVVFKTKEQLDSSKTRLSFTGAEELAPNEYVGLWIRRTVRASSGSGTVREDMTLDIQYVI